jgi:uncharacterized membrane protein
MKPWVRILLLVIDGLSLVGVIAFSVLAALNRDNSAYVAGQIVCAVLILISVVLLRAYPQRQ